MNLMIMARQLGNYPSTSLYHRHISQTPLDLPPTCIVSLPRRHDPFSLLPHLTLTSSSIPHAIQGGGGDGGRGGGGGGDDDHNDGSGDKKKRSILIGWLIEGWRSRVAADPEFPFKVLMEEVVGVSSFVAGDMASRPNFGLNELDFVFSTLVVGTILNFVLMYVLAPTSTTAGPGSMVGVGGMFSSCPQGHMFESGSYGIVDRLGTLIYKGILFSVVGFGAGLSGTAISNALITARKKMDPKFETGSNEPPPTVLNALTWAAHLGLSCNLRYQSVAGLEFVLAKTLPPMGFKACVIALRCFNNILGGVSFVMMARLTGSQKQKQKDTQPPQQKKVKF